MWKKTFKHIHTYIVLYISACALTCLGNDSRVLAEARLLTQAAEVFTVDAEHVFVAHDQIRSCAVLSSVVLINSEPFLEGENLSFCIKKTKITNAANTGWRLSQHYC